MPGPKPAPKPDPRPDRKDDPSEAPPTLAGERRQALLQAAVQVFLRYGYRKASMDEVARAAGLSRQGLYLHFPSKDLLFREAVGSLLDSTLSAARAALTDASRSIEERLVGALDAMYGQHIEGIGATAHLAELFETSKLLVGSQITDQEQAFRDALAATLQGAGVAAPFAAAALTARDLADLLDALACGIKHRVRTQAAFLERARAAARLLCAPR